nr:immunoglobulin light chain junction region [Macaca mulatta]MOX24411.1 immunoglobulin light chain junction region [Macaca mulatta]MOX24659.1 immunoglobulin light chain junction region [Macaca mulatta]MOX24773.1 immunoglobulin light chain junction region [Macaca mulatta]MOX25236.1 immunoglobulin light chain junction region [Macaca mulatta]
CLQAYSTPFTF